MEPLKIQTFLDGVCDIYRLDPLGQPEKIFGGIPLDERTVGSRRAFDAMQAGHTIAKVIRIPELPKPLNGCFVMIQDEQLQLLQAQTITDTCPRCWQLTLEQPQIRWAVERRD